MSEESEFMDKYMSTLFRQMYSNNTVSYGPFGVDCKKTDIRSFFNEKNLDANKMAEYFKAQLNNSLSVGFVYKYGKDREISMGICSFNYSIISLKFVFVVNKLDEYVFSMAGNKDISGLLICTISEVSAPCECVVS